MDSPGYTSLTRQSGLLREMQAVANNIANISTTGFRREGLLFAEHVAALEPGEPSLSMANASVRHTDTEQGPLTQTGGTFDFAIEGDGFFKVAMPDGSFGFTRDGAFVLNAEGQIVNGDGRLLDPQITIPNTAESITISETGEVSYLENGAQSIAGTIELYRFSNPAGLRQHGGNIYLATDASGAEIAGAPGTTGFGRIRNRFLEGSNVEVVSEMVSLITAQRAYEINSRAIRAGDEMLSNTSQIVR